MSLLKSPIFILPIFDFSSSLNFKDLIINHHIHISKLKMSLLKSPIYPSYNDSKIPGRVFTVTIRLCKISVLIDIGTEKIHLPNTSSDVFSPIKCQCPNP